jgi:hypothetical protein
MRSMLRSIALRGVAAVLALMLAGNSVAWAAGPPRALDPAKLKQTLMRRGIGMGFKVREVDGTRVTGVLIAIHDDSFEITAKGTAQAVSIPYAEVSAIHADGRGGGSAAATAGKIAGGFAIGLGVFCIMVVGLSMAAMHGG